MLVAHKKGDGIVRLSTDDGTYQGDAFGTDTEETPEWAKDRPTQSEPEYQREAAAAQ